MMSQDEDDPVLDLVRNWSRAFAKRHRETVRAEINNIDIDAFRLARFVTRALRKDDRSVSLLLFSYFDEFMLSRIKSIIHRHANDLLGPERPLFHSYPRLLLAHGLGWISDDTYAGLNLMRRIRNEFAHNSEIDQFSDDPIIGLVASMPKVETMVYDDRNGNTDGKYKPKAELSVRELYLLRSSFFVGNGIVELISHPQFIQAGIRPTALYADGRRAIPENIKLLMAVTVDLMVSVCAEPAHLKHIRKRGRTLKHRYERNIRSFEKDEISSDQN
jgi:DNA-binding MltR family transcriptional regulator